jgi:hypothetical protein
MNQVLNAGSFQGAAPGLRSLQAPGFAIGWGGAFRRAGGDNQCHGVGVRKACFKFGSMPRQTVTYGCFSAVSLLGDEGQL